MVQRKQDRATAITDHRPQRRAKHPGSLRRQPEADRQPVRGGAGQEGDVLQYGPYEVADWLVEQFERRGIKVLRSGLQQRSPGVYDITIQWGDERGDAGDKSGSE